jgi:hypothetical protein
MQIDEEVRALRSEFHPMLVASGQTDVAGLDNEQFSALLRERLMTLTGGKRRVGFDYSSSRSPTGDYLVMLVWSPDASRTHPRTSVGFSASGRSEILAFLRAAGKILHHPGYRALMVGDNRSGGGGSK